MSTPIPPRHKSATVFDEAIQERLEYVIIDTVQEIHDEPQHHIPSDHVCPDSAISRPICDASPRRDWETISTDGFPSGYRRFCADCRVIALNMFDISPALARDDETRER